MKGKAIVDATRERRYFYAKEVNMNLSFDSLQKIAEKFLGASLELGDIIICDNTKRDKRKVLQMTEGGFMIYYGRLTVGHEFSELSERNGRLRKPDHSLF